MLESQQELSHKNCFFYQIAENLPKVYSVSREWSGGAKVSCILCHRGVQLILAYSWARPAILVAGKGTGGCFYFFCFFTFIPVPLSSLSLSFISSTISSTFFLPFSGRRYKMTHKVSLNPNTIKVQSLNRSALCVKKNQQNDILKHLFFSYFSQQTGLDISCKSPQVETICMKCQNLFSGKIRKI